MSTTTGVYWIYQSNRDRAVYVGSSNNVERRLRNHKAYMEHGTHKNRRLQSTWAKYASTDFTFELLEAVQPEHLIEREQFWMDALTPSCNISLAADSPNRGRQFSEEHLRRMSDANRGKMPSADNLRKLHEGNRGKTRSPELRLKISKSLTGRTPSEETKLKISNALKGIKKPPRDAEYCRNIGNAMRGRTFSAETRLKMSEAAKNRKPRPE
jgi:group I intron endonuclease